MTSPRWRSGPSARLAGRRDEALALLAGRLGEELLDPEAEPGRGRVEQTLSRPLAPALAEREPELEPGVAVVAAAGLGHLRGAVEEALEVDAHQRRRHEPEQARAPSSGRRSSARPAKTARKPRSCATRSSSEPGSVIAANCAPRPPRRSQK